LKRNSEYLFVLPDRFSLRSHQYGLAITVPDTKSIGSVRKPLKIQLRYPYLKREEGVEERVYEKRCVQ